MKFNELTIRELRAQAKAACDRVVAMLPKEKKEKFSCLIVDFIEPMAMEDEQDKDSEVFAVLGHVRLTDGSTVPFKVDLVWYSHVCAPACGDDSVEFIDIDVDSLII